MSDRDELQRALQLLAGDGQPDAGDPRPPAHPPAQVLTAYQAGELEVGGAREVAAHLAGCADCRGRLADLLAFLGEPSPGAAAAQPGATSPDANAAWQQLSGRLAHEIWPDGTPFRRSGLLGQLRSAPPVVHAVYACAAAALAVVIGLAVWGLQRDRLEVQTEVTLEILGPVRGEDEVEVRPVAGSQVLNLRLVVGEEPELTEYGVVVLDARDETVARIERGLVPQRDGVISIALPRPLLRADEEYRVRVRGWRQGRPEEHGRAAFRIVR